MKSDHEPHFHAEPECYYVVNGQSKTLTTQGFQVLSTGQYFYIPGWTIHNTPILNDDGLGVLYWYPGQSNFSSFKYYWVKDVQDNNQAISAFEGVDDARRRDLNLGPYGTN
eukprot:Awhi_evm1s4652